MSYVILCTKANPVHRCGGYALIVLGIAIMAIRPCHCSTPGAAAREDIFAAAAVSK